MEKVELSHKDIDELAKELYKEATASNRDEAASAEQERQAQIRAAVDPTLANTLAPTTYEAASAKKRQAQMRAAINSVFAETAAPAPAPAAAAAVGGRGRVAGAAARSRGVQKRHSVHRAMLAPRASVDEAGAVEMPPPQGGNVLARPVVRVQQAAGEAPLSAMPQGKICVCMNVCIYVCRCMCMHITYISRGRR